MSLPRNDEEVLLLHNPRCSKSRQVKALLEGRGVAFTERRYLDEPLSAEELGDLAGRLALPVREWTRRGEAAFGEAGLSAESSDAELLAAIAEHPILMERPIVVRGAHAKVGRPPAEVEGLLQAE